MSKNMKLTIEVQGTAIEFLGLWEKLNHPDFKPLEFDGIRMQVAGYELKMWDGFLNGLGYLG